MLELLLQSLQQLSRHLEGLDARLELTLARLLEGLPGLSHHHRAFDDLPEYLEAFVVAGSHQHLLHQHSSTFCVWITHITTR